MPGEGNYALVDMASVKANAQNSITYLKKKLPQIPARKFVVVFLGEQHGNATDQAVTRGILQDPPLVKPGMKVIFERGLDALYVLGGAFGLTAEDTEPFHEGLNRMARSKLIADMIQQKFGDGIELVYVVCGSEHATEIYDALNKRNPDPFTFIAKLSSTD